VRLPHRQGRLQDQGDPGDHRGVHPGGQRDAPQLHREGRHRLRGQRRRHSMHLPHLHHHVRDELAVSAQGGHGALHPTQGHQHWWRRSSQLASVLSGHLTGRRPTQSNLCSTPDWEDGYAHQHSEQQPPRHKSPQPCSVGDAERPGAVSEHPADPRDDRPQRAHRMHHRQGRLQGGRDQATLWCDDPHLQL